MSLRPGQLLDVHLRGERVGSLEHRDPGRYRFTYSPDAVARHGEGAIVLSASLPLARSTFPPVASRPFFEGLLPEGTVRTTVARSLGLSADNGFALLSELGAECAGAVVVVPEGQSPETAGGETVEWLDENALAAKVADLPRHPLGIDPGDEGARMSLGGVQDKLLVVRDSTGGFGIPKNGTPSTHILKPAHPGYEGLVANEAFCLQVAQCAGLLVPRIELIDVGDVPCLLVERFDRERDEAGSLVRVHQEDACQALGSLPGEKYEAEGGPGVSDLFQLVRDVAGPRAARDINTLLRATVVNVVLGNSDAHGKNFALIHEPAGSRLAPLYDIVCTTVYDDLTDRLAMSLGGTERPDEVRRESWRELGRQARLGANVVDLAADFAARVSDCVASVQAIARAEGWHRPVIDRIASQAQRRVQSLASPRG